MHDYEALKYFWLFCFAVISVLLPVVVWVRYRTGMAAWLCGAVVFIYLAAINSIAGSSEQIRDVFRFFSIVCATVYVGLAIWLEKRDSDLEE